MKILFMGTPDFAVFSLRALVDAGYSVVGAVTQPDKPSGRGYTLTPPAVKVYAEEQDIPVFQPTTLKDGAFAETLEALSPDLIVVAAYGKILPPYVLEYPRLGCINIHGSLLPRHRGAAPMQRAILEGDAETGVTLMYMAEGLDTGDMLAKAAIPLEEEDNFETVHDKLGALGALVLLDLVPDLENGTAVRTPQPEAGATYAQKITKEDCKLDFSASARDLHNRIRALSPFPLAFTHTPDGKMLKITSARRAEGTFPGEAGTVTLSQGRLFVTCGRGEGIELLSVLPEGKSRMSAADYLRGRKLNDGDLLK